MYNIPYVGNKRTLMSITGRMLEAAREQKISAGLNTFVRDNYVYTTGEAERKWFAKFMMYRNMPEVMHSVKILMERCIDGLSMHIDLKNNKVIFSKVYAVNSRAQLQSKWIYLYDVLLFAQLTQDDLNTFATISEISTAIALHTAKAKEVIRRFMIAHLQSDVRDVEMWTLLEREVKDYVACRKGRDVPNGIKVDTSVAAYPYSYVLFKALHHKNAITRLRNYVYIHLDRQLLLNCTQGSVVDGNIADQYPRKRLALVREGVLHYYDFGTCMAQALVNDSPIAAEFSFEADAVLNFAKVNK